MSTRGDAPIGIFDSGMGGLAVAAAVRRRLPDERLLYLADTAHRPFGPRSAEEVARYVRDAERFFRAEGAKAMVIACNTASVVANVADESIPTIEMVEPGVRAALALRPRRVGVLGTQGTIESGAHERALRLLDPTVDVRAHACEQALRLAEQGGGDDPVALERLLAECLWPITRAGCDVTILACTDFTCVRPVLDRAAGGGTTLLDPADAVADLLAERIRTGRIPLGASPGRDRFCLTAPDPTFARMGQEVFGLTIGSVELVAPS